MDVRSTSFAACARGESSPESALAESDFVTSTFAVSAFCVSAVAAVPAGEFAAGADDVAAVGAGVLAGEFTFGVVFEFAFEDTFETVPRFDELPEEPAACVASRSKSATYIMIDLLGNVSADGVCEKYSEVLAASHGGATTAGDTSRRMVVRNEKTRMICLIGSELRRVGAPLQNATSQRHGVDEERIPF